MEGYLKILFIRTETLVGKFIRLATKGIYNHLAIITSEGLIEAIQPRVTISALDKYDDCKTEVIQVYVPNLEMALTKAKSLIGTRYGIIDCFDGGVEDIFHIQLRGDGEKTVDCCEVAVRTLRAGGVKIVEDINADCFTPQSLYVEIKKCTDFVHF